MNVGTLLERSAMLHGSKTATSYAKTSLSYADFDARANSLANALLDIGVKKGDRVAIIQNNCPQLLE